MLWQLVLVVAALGAACYRWSRRRIYRLAEEIPAGVKAYPVVGHAYMFIGSGEGLTDPDAIAVVAKTSLDKDKFTVKFMKRVFANGTIFAPVNIWHSRRKIMAPFFRLKNLKEMVKMFDEQSRVMTDMMTAEVGTGNFEFWKYITAYILDAKLETVLGMKLKCQGDESNFLLRAVYEMMEMVLARMLQPWQHPDCVYESLPVYKQFMHHTKLACGFIDEIIQKRRKNDVAAEAGHKGMNSDTLRSFMDVIIQCFGEGQKGYSDLELREELMGIIVAGNDTYSVASSFTALLLSRYPHVQDRVHRELQDVFGDSDRAVVPEDLPRLKYLEAVINETLRLYPPAAIIMREIHEDVVLPSGTTLVDGVSVVINIWGAHRNPSYWGADAELFRPERFLQGPLPHPAMFIPFSYSVRGCVGATYAMLSMKTVMANLLRRYRLQPPTGARAADPAQPPPIPVKLDIMMKAVDNFVVRVEKK